MLRHRIAISAAFAAALAVVPLASAEAQYYPYCNPFPLSWPFCVAGAAVGTAATIATLPFRAAAGPYYYPYSYGPYYAPAYYYPRRHYRRHHHIHHY